MVESMAAALGCDPIELTGGAVLSAAELAVVTAIRIGDPMAAMQALMAAMRER